MWSPLTHWRVLRTLHNARYAGAFAYGQRRTRKTPEGKTTTRSVPREEWTLIPDAHPGYITFEQYEQNLRTLAANAPRTALIASAARPAKAPRCCKASLSAAAAATE